MRRYNYGNKARRGPSPTNSPKNKPWAFSNKTSDKQRVKRKSKCYCFPKALQGLLELPSTTHSNGQGPCLLIITLNHNILGSMKKHYNHFARKASLHWLLICKPPNSIGFNTNSHLAKWDSGPYSSLPIRNSSSISQFSCSSHCNFEEIWSNLPLSSDWIKVTLPFREKYFFFT